MYVLLALLKFRETVSRWHVPKLLPPRVFPAGLAGFLLAGSSVLALSLDSIDRRKFFGLAPFVIGDGQSGLSFVAQCPI